MSGLKIVMVAGEASGDLHGSNLARAIRSLSPQVEIYGYGGGRMASAGVTLWSNLMDLAVVGFAEVAKKLFIFRRLLRELAARLDSNKPQAVVLIDFPGFNLRVAGLAKERNIPVIYYIGPQVWAWGAGRIDRIARTVTKMIVILPFEEELYKKRGIDAEFVGHPLLDIVRPTMSKTETYRQLGVVPKEPVIALLPGSRRQEVIKLLPIMLVASERISQEIPGAQYLIGLAATISSGEIAKMISKAKVPLKVIRGKTYEVMNIADLILVASGTATLEAACLGKPMIVLYKVSWASWIIAKLLVKIPYISLVNIVAGRGIVPEFLQERARAKEIAEEALELLRNEKRQEEMIRSLREVKTKLGRRGASQRAARLVLRVVQSSLES